MEKIVARSKWMDEAHRIVSRGTQGSFALSCDRAANKISAAVEGEPVEVMRFDLLFEKDGQRYHLSEQDLDGTFIAFQCSPATKCWDQVGYIDRFGRYVFSTLDTKMSFCFQFIGYYKSCSSEKHRDYVGFEGFFDAPNIDHQESMGIVQIVHGFRSVMLRGYDSSFIFPFAPVSESSSSEPELPLEPPAPNESRNYMGRNNMEFESAAIEGDIVNNDNTWIN